VASRHGWQKAQPQERKKASSEPSMAGTGRWQAVQRGRVRRGVLKTRWVAGVGQGVADVAAGARGNNVSAYDGGEGE
jgi:hypothetical protein